MGLGVDVVSVTGLGRSFMLLQVEIDRRWLLVGCSRVSAAGLGPPCPKGWGRTVADLAHEGYDVERGSSMPTGKIPARGTRAGLYIGM